MNGEHRAIVDRELARAMEQIETCGAPEVVAMLHFVRQALQAGAERKLAEHMLTWARQQHNAGAINWRIGDE